MSYTITKLTWSDIIKDVLQLADKIKSADVIITVGRGGNIPGTMLGYKLGTKQIVNFGVQSYNDDKSTTNITVQQEPDINELNNKKVVVVDDLSDKGTTLEYVRAYLTEKNINSEFCTLYIKEGTKFLPNHFTRAFKPDEWIEFPWDDLSSS